MNANIVLAAGLLQVDAATALLEVTGFKNISPGVLRSRQP